MCYKLLTEKLKVGSLMRMTISLLVALYGSWLSEAAHGSTAAFELRDAKGDEVLLVGTESSRRNGEMTQRETTYESPDGTSLGIRELAEFQGSTLQRLVTEDGRSGERVEVRTQGDGVFAIDILEGAGASPKSSVVTTPKGTILGKSIPALLLERWQDLQAGRTIKFRLLVPEHRDTYGFRARRLAQGSNGEARVVVEADSWVVRVFAPELVFQFTDTETPRLKELQAPSPVVIDGQKYRPVRMVFSDSH